MGMETTQGKYPVQNGGLIDLDLVEYDTTKLVYPRFLVRLDSNSPHPHVNELENTALNFQSISRGAFVDEATCLFLEEQCLE